MSETTTEQRRAPDYEKWAKFVMSISGRACVLLNNARSRARKNNVQCTLTKAWIMAKLKAGKCEVTGIPFEIRVGNGKGHRNNSFSPSLDRIDQAGAYSPKNVRMTCWIYNRARGAFPDGDFEKMLTALYERKKMQPGSCGGSLIN